MSRRTVTCILMGIALSATVVSVGQSTKSAGPCRGRRTAIPISRACGPTTA